MAEPSVSTRQASVALEVEAEVSEVAVEAVVATEAEEVVDMVVVDMEVVIEVVEVMAAETKVATLAVEAAMEAVVVTKDTPVVGVATEEASSSKVAVGNKCLSGPVFSLTRSYISRTEKSAWVAAKVNCVEGLELPSWMVDMGQLRGSGCGFTLASSCALLGVRGDSYLLCHTF